MLDDEMKFQNSKYTEIKEAPSIGVLEIFVASIAKLQAHLKNVDEVYFSEEEVRKYTHCDFKSDKMAKFYDDLRHLKIYYFNYKRKNLQNKGFNVFKSVMTERDCNEQMRLTLFLSYEMLRYMRNENVEYYKVRLSIARKRAEVNTTATDNRKIYIIDTETTGLDPMTNELLQVSIIDGNGEIKYNSYIKPIFAKEWKDAEAVNGITPEMVSMSPTIDMVASEITEVISDAQIIIGYNNQFDMSFLQNSGIAIPKAAEQVDVMRLFAPIYGEWSEERHDYKFKSLSICAKYYGFDWSAIKQKAHNSLGDCYATLFCYEKIAATSTE